MKVLFAVHGTRGDVEPCAAAARELARRGHEAMLAVPPDLMKLPESVGLTTYTFGPDSRIQLDEKYNVWRIGHLIPALRANKDYLSRGAAQMSATLKELARDVDLLVTGVNFEEVVANVAEAYDIPFAAMHWSPMRPAGHVIPWVPPLVNRVVSGTVLGVKALLTRGVDKRQRSELGLPNTAVLPRNALEIQTYDDFFYPGLANEWRNFNRPFVGPLSLELPTLADDEVIDWVTSGAPPIYFGFGTLPGRTMEETIGEISAACSEIGARGLIYAPGLAEIVHADHVKPVREMSVARVVPHCRAAVHHGGWGTTMTGLRAGVPTLILWHGAEQPLFGWHVRRLRVGSSRRLAGTTRKKLVNKLRAVLSPDCAVRAGRLARRISSNADSVRRTADLLEDYAATRPGYADPS